MKFSSNAVRTPSKPRLTDPATMIPPGFRHWSTSANTAPGWVPGVRRTELLRGAWRQHLDDVGADVADLLWCKRGGERRHGVAAGGDGLDGGREILDGRERGTSAMAARAGVAVADDACLLVETLSGDDIDGVVARRGHSNLPRHWSALG